MEMTALRSLHQCMIAIGTDVQQFQIKMGAASFDCLFSTRDTPFVLTLTSRGKMPGFFRFDVGYGYKIKDYFGDFYSELATVLHSDGASGERLMPKVFLAQLNQAIPTEASVKANPSPSEIVRLRPDVVDDRDKPYFDTWMYWDEPRRPTAENMHKTLILLGREALEHSRTQNASSKWSVHDTSTRWQNAKRR